MKAIRIVVSGRVQGVCYRASTREQAERLGVAGWVRNLPDGDVEVYAEGQRSALTELAKWCERGPDFAHVANIQVDWCPAQGDQSGFTIRV